MKIINILYDVDVEEDKELLPTEIEIPADMIDENGEFDDDEISDYISDVTGYCHFGFDVVEDT